jgi:DNA-binding transcriptional regulator YdaS (Cro superfamily)
MFRYDYWIFRAIAICGSQKELARRMGVKPEKISYLLNRAKKISLEDALKIEVATGGKVTRYHLMGRINIKVKHQLEEKIKAVNELRISEQTTMAMAFEKEIGERRGRPHIEISRNLDELKGRTDDIAAKKYGFVSKDRYRQAKQVVEYGTLELINAMDSKRVAISTAAKLIRLPEDEQYRVLQLGKKEIIAQAKRIQQISNNNTKELSKDYLDAFLLNSLRIYFLLMPYTSRSEVA